MGWGAGFVPYCLSGVNECISLHVVADGLIAFCYYAMPLVVFRLAVKHKGLPFRALFCLAGAFVGACGTGHAMGVVAVLYPFWPPGYWSSGGVHIVTAVASVGTALALIEAVPRIRHLLDAQTRLADTERRLTEEAEKRRRAEDTVIQLHEWAREHGRPHPDFKPSHPPASDPDFPYLQAMWSEPIDTVMSARRSGQASGP